jgi:phage terminase Nu1 subunit (DNA packaging protein)
VAQVDTRMMTQAEYSRHRDCSREAVRKAVDAGRIKTFGPDKLIDAELADAQWARNTRARVRGGESEASQPAAAQIIVANEVGATTSYEEARRRRETAEANLAEMKQAEMEGKLILADAVRSAWAAKITGARDALLQIPSRIAPVLAAETDLVEVTALLEAELRQALAELSTEAA